MFMHRITKLVGPALIAALLLLAPPAWAQRGRGHVGHVGQVGHVGHVGHVGGGFGRVTHASAFHARTFAARPFVGRSNIGRSFGRVGGLGFRNYGMHRGYSPYRYGGYFGRGYYGRGYYGGYRPYYGSYGSYWPYYGGYGGFWPYYGGFGLWPWLATLGSYLGYGGYGYGGYGYPGDYGNYYTNNYYSPDYGTYPSIGSYAAAPPVAITVPAATGAAAVVTVDVPPSAQVWFDGVQMTQPGAVRQFTSPPLTPGDAYTYDVRARWTDNGVAVDQTRHIVVHAGDQVTVNFIPGGQ
jgi:uncharacterized protein (TIGR03000 family)